MSALDWVKKHPYITGGVVLAGVAVILLTSGDSNTSGTSVAYTSDTAYGTELQLAQIAAQAQTAQTSAALSASQYQTAAQADVLKYQYDREYDTAALSASVALANIAAQASTAQMQSTLSAQIAQAQLAAQTQQNAQNVDLMKTYISETSKTTRFTAAILASK